MASGKTFLIGQWLKSITRYVRFDSTGETLDDASVTHIWKSPKALYEKLLENPYYFRIAYHPGTNLQEDFFWVVKCLWRLDVYKTLVCDEFHEVCSVNETPKFVQTMMRYARHNRLAVIGASQRIADVHKLFTSGSRKVVIFYSQEARDYAAVQDRWGREAADMMMELRPLLYDDQTKNTRQVPQCLVIAKGAPIRVYDFAKDAYVNVGERPDSEEDSGGIQDEDSGSEPSEQSGEWDTSNDSQPENAPPENES
jgi:hypothetical protein